MTAYLELYDGRMYELPRLLEWSFTHTLGESADAFYLEAAYDESMTAVMPDVVRLKATENGSTVFYGVIDEYEVVADEGGAVCSVSGRGMAAILMDNESEAMEYSAAVLASILRDHVEPYGIKAKTADSMKTLAGYRISSGESEWNVLKEYTYWAAGITPRFTPAGELVLSKAAGRRLKADKTNGITGVRLKNKRYGVISEVLVKGNTNRARSTVYNSDFIVKGGMARRVVCVPNSTGYDTMRYTGEHRIERSERDRETLEVSFSRPFMAFANDIIELSIPELGVNGVYIVDESTSRANAVSCGTELKLLPYRE